MQSKGSYSQVRMLHWLNFLRIPFKSTYSICLIIPGQPCNCSGLPQCYVCNSTSLDNCIRNQELVTCPHADVCSQVLNDSYKLTHFCHIYSFWLATGYRLKMIKLSDVEFELIMGRTILLAMFNLLLSNQFISKEPASSKLLTESAESVTSLNLSVPLCRQQLVSTKNEEKTKAAITFGFYRINEMIRMNCLLWIRISAGVNLWYCDCTGCMSHGRVFWHQRQ